MISKGCLVRWNTARRPSPAPGGPRAEPPVLLVISVPYTVHLRGRGPQTQVVDILDESGEVQRRPIDALVKVQ
jgi:hypothetical protein